MRTTFAQQFPHPQRDQSQQVTEILGAGIPDSVEKRSYATTTHPLNRTRRSGTARSAGPCPGGEVRSGPVQRDRSSPGDPMGGLREDPPQPAPTHGTPGLGGVLSTIPKWLKTIFYGRPTKIEYFPKKSKNDLFG